MADEVLNIVFKYNTSNTFNNKVSSTRNLFYISLQNVRVSAAHEPHYSVRYQEDLKLRKLCNFCGSSFPGNSLTLCPVLTHSLLHPSVHCIHVIMLLSAILQTKRKNKEPQIITQLRPPNEPHLENTALTFLGFFSVMGRRPVTMLSMKMSLLILMTWR